MEAEVLAFIFNIAILIMSVVAHEVSHGYAANSLGDPTARLEGRLTLNPLNHLDLMGSFIVPVVTFFSMGIIFGWAKPVPYNPYQLKNPRSGGAIIAAAGPLMNVAVAFVFALLIRSSDTLGLPASFTELASFVVFINLLLAVFNSIPIPPLDGSKILFAILPLRFRGVEAWLEAYWPFVFILLLFVLWNFISPIVFTLFRLLTGLSM